MSSFHQRASSFCLIPVFTGLLFSPFTQKLPHISVDSPPYKIEVSNNLDTVDGDTSSILALQASPGPDSGISLREAIQAANNTSGLKIITFSPALSGGTIRVGETTATSLPILTGGDLTIDGDIDGDGAPDITLDGSLRTNPSLGNGLNIWSSNVTIQHMHLSGFKEAILWGAPGSNVPGLMPPITISNSQILSNVIDGALDGETQDTGVIVGPLGWLDVHQAAALSYITYQNLVVSDNVIKMPVGIFMYASAGSGGHNRISNVKIQNNTLTGGGIGMVSGDANTLDTDPNGALAYSDHNVIEDVQVLDNTVSAFQYVGITMVAANMGNRDNVLRRITVTGNTIHGTLYDDFAAGPGILIASGGGSRWADRVTSGNEVSDIEIRDNSLQDLFQGMLICSGQAWYGPGVENNTVERVNIQDNHLENVGPVGIAAAGAFYNFDGGTIENNTLDALTITGNEISGLRGNLPGEGIHVSGGWNAPYYSAAGPTKDNTVTHLLVNGNTVSGFDIGLSISGGDGPDVTGNSVSGYWAANQGNLVAADNLNGAVDNHLIWHAPYQVNIPLVIR